MANFCNFCSKEMFGDVKPDIDVYNEFDQLESNIYINIGICEGCGLVAVMRDIHDKLKVCYAVGFDERGDINTYTDWMDYTNRFHKNGD